MTPYPLHENCSAHLIRLILTPYSQERVGSKVRQSLLLPLHNHKDLQRTNAFCKIDIHYLTDFVVTQRPPNKWVGHARCDIPDSITN